MVVLRDCSWQGLEGQIRSRYGTCVGCVRPAPSPAALFICSDLGSTQCLLGCRDWGGICSQSSEASWPSNDSQLLPTGRCEGVKVQRLQPIRGLRVLARPPGPASRPQSLPRPWQFLSPDQRLRTKQSTASVESEAAQETWQEGPGRKEAERGQRLSVVCLGGPRNCLGGEGSGSPGLQHLISWLMASSCSCNNRARVCASACPLGDSSVEPKRASWSSSPSDTSMSLSKAWATLARTLACWARSQSCSFSVCTCRVRRDSEGRKGL